MVKKCHVSIDEGKIYRMWFQAINGRNYLIPGIGIKTLYVDNTANTFDAKIQLGGDLGFFIIPQLSSGYINCQGAENFTFIGDSSLQPCYILATNADISPTESNINQNVNVTNGSLVFYNGSGVPADGYFPNQGTVGSFEEGFNDNPYNPSWDKWRNNQSTIGIASAATTIERTSNTFTNYNGKGIMVFLNVTAVSVTGGLVLKIVGSDPYTGADYVLNPLPVAVTAIGSYAFELFPGSTGAVSPGVVQRTAGILPRYFKLKVTPVDATSYSYSVNYAVNV